MSMKDNGRGKNFRLSYLGSLGISNVRQTIDGILKENVIDISQLRKVAQNFEIPSSHRPTVWKLLLGVLPIYKESWDWINGQLEESYSDLNHSGAIITPSRPPILSSPNSSQQNFGEHADNVYHVYASFMYFHNFIDEEDPADVKRIAAVLMRVLDSRCWAFSALRAILVPKDQRPDPTAESFRVANRFLRLLETHDPELWKLFRAKNVPLEHISFGWIRTVFAGRIAEKFLPMLWDKVFSRAPDYKACVALALIVLLKPKFVSCDDANTLRARLKTEPIVSIEGVISKANEVFSGLGVESRDTESPLTSGPIPQLSSPH